MSEATDNAPPSIQAEPVDPSAMPLPSDPKTVFLGGIFLILLLVVLRLASEIIIPIVLAFVLKLVFQPLMRFLSQRLQLPRAIAAFFIVFLLLAGLAGVGTALSTPAASWADKFPGSIEQLQERLGFLSKSVAKTEKMLGKAEDLTKTAGGTKVVPVAIQGTRLSDKFFDGTQAFVSGIFTTMLVFFFLLIAGDTFLRRLVEVLPKFKDKRQAVDISQQIEQDISVYLLTITFMNAVVGVATALMLWACGVSDPALWGMLAFLMNYVPIMGPLVAAFIFLVVGLLGFENFGMALLPAALYMVIHLLEGTFITPMLLAKRFVLNPVLVILSLVFWYWMWGLAGAILAVPMLAITKIVCDRINTLSAFGHFLEG